MDDLRDYALLVFDSGAGYNQEVEILKSFVESDGMVAACFPLNIHFFSSRFDKKDIATQLTDGGIKFMLTDRRDIVMELPPEIRKSLDELAARTSQAQPKKMTLQEQLKIAEKKGDFKLCAKLRDMINPPKIDTVVPAKVRKPRTTKKTNDDITGKHKKKPAKRTNRSKA